MPPAPRATPPAVAVTPAELRDMMGLTAAITRSLAVVEFDLEGTVLTANQNFLDVMGFTLREVVGQHHRMFCTTEHAESQAYRDFWKKLASGCFVQDVFRGVAKVGREVWLQAT